MLIVVLFYFLEKASFVVEILITLLVVGQCIRSIL
jgi:hypothetical protein